MTARDLAANNFARHIAQNPYPGRGIVVGRNREDQLLLIYWIMGRSENSRNRRFVAEGGTLRTEPVDVSKVADPSLIIYEAMLERPQVQLVSNGDQTRTILVELDKGGSFESALGTREREPDAPNYTPRISALYDGTKREIVISVLKANAFDPQLTDRFYYRPALPALGFGLCVTTYRGDGTPLPSFAGEPMVVPCTGSADEVLHAYWRALDASNRISIAVKTVALTGETLSLRIENRFA